MAAPQSLSQPTTSFIAAWRQGIHRLPFMLLDSTEPSKFSAHGGGLGTIVTNKFDRSLERPESQKSCIKISDPKAKSRLLGYNARLGEKHTLFELLYPQIQRGSSSTHHAALRERCLRDVPILDHVSSCQRSESLDVRLKKRTRRSLKTEARQGRKVQRLCGFDLDVESIVQAKRFCFQRRHRTP